MKSDLLQIQSCGVSIYALRDDEGIVLIDSGFIGARRALLKAIRKVGWDVAEIVGVILTHGHLDHTLNAAWFAGEFGAWVAAPEADREHVAGTHRYRGTARVCGWMEAVGRRVLRYEGTGRSALVCAGGIALIIGADWRQCRCRGIRRGIADFSVRSGGCCFVATCSRASGGRRTFRRRS